MPFIPEHKEFRKQENRRVPNLRGHKAKQNYSSTHTTRDTILMNTEGTSFLTTFFMSLFYFMVLLYLYLFIFTNFTLKFTLEQLRHISVLQLLHHLGVH